MEGEQIQLTIPALPAYTRLARVAIVGLATRSGFTFDEVEDLRLAVGEVCVGLLDGEDPASRLHVSFRPAPGRIEIHVEATGTVAARDDEDRARSDRILRSTVDAVVVSDDRRQVTITKAATDAD